MCVCMCCCFPWKRGENKRKESNLNEANTQPLIMKLFGGADRANRYSTHATYFIHFVLYSVFLFDSCVICVIGFLLFERLFCCLSLVFPYSFVQFYIPTIVRSFYSWGWGEGVMGTLSIGGWSLMKNESEVLSKFFQCLEDEVSFLTSVFSSS